MAEISLPSGFIPAAPREKIQRARTVQTLESCHSSQRVYFVCSAPLKLLSQTGTDGPCSVLGKNVALRKRLWISDASLNVLLLKWIRKKHWRGFQANTLRICLYAYMQQVRRSQSQDCVSCDVADVPTTVGLHLDEECGAVLDGFVRAARRQHYNPVANSNQGLPQKC